MSQTKEELKAKLRVIEEKENKEAEQIAKERLEGVVGLYYQAKPLTNEDAIIVSRFYKENGGYGHVLKETWFYYHTSYFGCKVNECWHSPNMEDCDKLITKTEFSKMKKQILDIIGGFH